MFKHWIELHKSFRILYRWWWWSCRHCRCGGYLREKIMNQNAAHAQRTTGIISVTSPVHFPFVLGNHVILEARVIGSRAGSTGWEETHNAPCVLFSSKLKLKNLYINPRQQEMNQLKGNRDWVVGVKCVYWLCFANEFEKTSMSNFLRKLSNQSKEPFQFRVQKAPMQQGEEFF